MPRVVGGRLIITPQVVSQIDDAALVNLNTPGSGTIGILGESAGGDPSVVYSFTNASQARAQLIAGKLLDAVERAYAPSTQVAGAYTIRAIRVAGTGYAKATAVLGPPISSPTAPTLVGSASGGTLPAATYNYKITALAPVGETLASPGAGSAVTTSGSTSSITVNWTAVAGAVGYKVYGRTAGSELLIATLGNVLTYIDTGAVTPAGALPVANTTAPSAITSVDTGAWNNSIRYSIAAGTTTGFKLTVSSNPGAFTSSISTTSTGAQDNITRQVMRLTNTSGSPVSVTITATQLSLGATNFPFATYPTIALLTSQINATTATHSFTAVILGNSDAQPSINFETLSATPVAAGATLILTQDVQALVDYINTYYNSLITALPLVTNPGAKTAWITTNLTYLAGGSDGAAVTTTSYQTAFDLLKAVDVQLVVPVSDSAAIHTMAETHCSTMSDVTNKSERVAILGGLNSDTVQATLARALNLNSCRAVIVYPGLKAFDNSGNLITLDPWQVASMVAGMASGVDVAEPLTNKQIRSQGLAITTLVPSDYDLLVQGGVLAITNRPNRGSVIVQSVTTWLNDRKYSNRELSVRRAADYIVRSVRDALDPLVGGKNGPALLGLVVSRTMGTLRELERLSVIVGDAVNPSFKDITARSEGDAVVLDFTASPALPANYIVLTAHLVPYSGTAVAVGSQR